MTLKVLNKVWVTDVAKVLRHIEVDKCEGHNRFARFVRRLKKSK